MTSNSSFLVGHHDSKRVVPISSSLVQRCHAANYDMLTFPLTTPHFHSKILSLLSTAFSESSHAHDGLYRQNASPVFVEPLTPADTQLTPDDSISSIIGVVSLWIDLSSADPIIADVSRQVLQLELAYAAFCGVSYVIVPGPRQTASADIAAYGRTILDGLNQGPYMQLYIWTATHYESSQAKDQVGDLASFARRQYVELEGAASQGAFSSWQAWDTVRAICRYSTRLCLALAIPRSLPPATVLSRWYSEPVRILTLDEQTFRKNAKGYPALPSDHQDYLLKLMKLKTQPWIIICDATPLPEVVQQPGQMTDRTFPTLQDAQTKPINQSNDDPHLLYIRHLSTKQDDTFSPMDQFGAGYQDYLQAPLQPLTVNLESITYEVFEKDPIKYEWYERAIARALHDWIEQGKPTSNPDGRVVVAVVGAGRGPLVSRALKAAEDVGVDIDMWGLEKNPNAYVLLQRHNENKWNKAVNLVKSDMRTWLGPTTTVNLGSVRKTYNLDSEVLPPDLDIDKAPVLPETDGLGSSDISMPTISRYKIDILISELLGSFADNELSPECLDGVQHLLNPIHGLSIPSSYTAHFTPVAAPKLHADISLSMVNVNPNSAEIPYVVMLDQIDFLSTTTSPEVPGPLSTTSSPTKPKSFASLFSNPSTPRQSAGSTATSKTTSPPSQTTPMVHTAWAFHHPNHKISSVNNSAAAPTNSHNARYCRLSFPIHNQGTCHGLAGYFETVLYPGVELSTNPLTMEQKSASMISWFPIFFPFKTPMILPEKSVVDISMWRQTDDRRVWYEWLLEVYVLVPDRSGKEVRIKVGSSELHSSEKEACLM